MFLNKGVISYAGKCNSDSTSKSNTLAVSSCVADANIQLDQCHYENIPDEIIIQHCPAYETVQRKYYND